MSACTEEWRPAGTVIAWTTRTRSSRPHRASGSWTAGAHRTAHWDTWPAHRAHSARIGATRSSHWRADATHVARMAAHGSSRAAHWSWSHHSWTHDWTVAGMTDETRVASWSASIGTRTELRATGTKTRMTLRRV